jgi:hypothetical protein
MAPEEVTRPDPGLARGVWEASPNALYLAAAAVLVVAAFYLAVRLGLLRPAAKPGPGRPRKL